MPAVTLGSIALSTAVGWGKSGAQKLGAAGYKKIVERLHRGQLDETDAVLKATHLAYVEAMDAMTRAAREVATGEEEERAAKALAEMANGTAFREFRGGEQFPLDQANDAIDRIFGADPDDAEAAGHAYNQLVVADLTAGGIELPPGLETLFAVGVGKHGPWDVVFLRAFRNKIANDEAAFRLLTLDGIGELKDSVEQMREELHALILERRGAEIAEAQIDDKAILRIAGKIAENVRDVGQALAEIDDAVDELVRLRAETEHTGNLDILVEQSLRRIDERARAGDFDAAAEEAERAYAEWDARELERRNRERAIGTKMVDENIRTNRLRRDAGAVVRWIIKGIELQYGDSQSRFDAAIKIIVRSIGNAKEKGGNFDLEISILLEELLLKKMSILGNISTIQNYLGNSLGILGERTANNDLLKRAINAFRISVSYNKLVNNRQDWADAKISLAGTYTKMGEKSTEVRLLFSAIATCESVINASVEESFGIYRAHASANMGIALAMLGDQTGDLSYAHRAVSAFREALKFITCESDSIEWASIQGNLGNALETIGVSDPDSEYLEQAEAAYLAALKILTRDFPLRWATIQGNLGVVSRRLAEAGRGTEYLDNAISAFRRALEIYVREDHLFNWGRMSENLASALVVRGGINKKPEYLLEAIDLLPSVLEAYSRPELRPFRRSAETTLGRAEELLAKV